MKKHVRVLEEAGLVTTAKVGLRETYERLDAMLARAEPAARGRA